MSEPHIPHEVAEFTRARGQAFFTARCQSMLGISGETFLRLYDAGAWDMDGPLHLTLSTLEMLIPYYREEPS